MSKPRPTPPLLKLGDVILIELGHKVNATVPLHYLYANRKGIMDRSDRGLVTVEGDLSYLKGMYIVERVTFDGGGTGHGPHDVYPDGHHVHCCKVINHDIKIDFYQTGCFTSLLRDITPVGKAERKWTVTSFTTPFST